MGPSVKTGKNVNAPTIKMTLSNSKTNRSPSVGNVPLVIGTYFFSASDPARARTGTIMKKRPIVMAVPNSVLYQGVLTLIPANADPLFPVADENAYKISESP